MKHKIAHVIIFFLCLFIVGCSIKSQGNNEEVIESTAKAIPEDQDTLQKTDYKLFINTPRKLELYEPKDGCYIGAYILSNSDLNFDIDNFEQRTGTSHGVYLRNMKLGAGFPIEWVLECTSKMKTPYIVLQPPSQNFPYQDFLLEETAKAFGEYFIPMFVQFYPNPGQYTNPNEYKDFFIKAKAAFKTYAPNVAFVWSVNAENAEESMIYYPGDANTDWIGINVYDLIYINDEKNKNNVFDNIDFIYYLFQSKKPLMISQLGISHYSKMDHGYYIDEACNRIEKFYKTISNNYPQIKCINYMDFDNIEVAPNETGYDNFKITDQTQLINSYRSVLKDKYFIDSIDIHSFDNVENQWIVSYYPIYKKGNEFYISEKVFKYEVFGMNLDIDEEDKVLLDHTIYYSLAKLMEHNDFQILINDDKKRIKVQNK